jgi:ribose 5-phosphate isomerase B
VTGVKRHDKASFAMTNGGPAAGSAYAAMPMRIAIGGDHAGFALKGHLVALLRAQGHDVDDLGTDGPEPVDYPPFCAAVGRAVRDGRAERGIVLGGSGQGEQLAANKVRGVRAALCNDLFTAQLSRAHNDANVLSMGARIVGEGLADAILAVWLATPFDGGRHATRVAMLAEIEAAERATPAPGA